MPGASVPVRRFLSNNFWRGSGEDWSVRTAAVTKDQTRIRLRMYTTEKRPTGSHNRQHTKRKQNQSRIHTSACRKNFACGQTDDDAAEAEEQEGRDEENDPTEKGELKKQIARYQRMKGARGHGHICLDFFREFAEEKINVRPQPGIDSDDANIPKDMGVLLLEEWASYCSRNACLLKLLRTFGEAQDEDQLPTRRSLTSAAPIPPPSS